MTLNIVIVVIFGVVAPVIVCYAIYSGWTADPLENLTYDEEDDLDEKSTIKIIDTQFQMGKVPQLREEFNKRRLNYLNSNQIEKYIRCVLDYDTLIS